MKSNLLRGPLVKSGAILLVFSMLVYYTSTSGQGDVWASIAMVFSLLFGLVKWTIGMVIGLVVCIGVLIGIFLGSVAVVNRDAAGDMYDALRAKLAEWLTPVLATVKSGKQSAGATGSVTVADDEFQNNVQTAVATEMGKVEASRSAQDKEINALSAKLQAQEAKAGSYATGDQLETVTADVNNFTEALGKIETSVAALQEGLADVGKKVDALTADKLLGDMPARIEQLEKQPAAEAVDLQPLEAKITGLQEELAAVKAGAEKAAAAPATEAPAKDGKENEEHRLLSYFDNDADKQKVVDLVQATLKKDMTYAQVMEHLAKQMGKEKGKVITEHPSLAKDYIRMARRS